MSDEERIEEIRERLAVVGNPENRILRDETNEMALAWAEFTKHAPDDMAFLLSKLAGAEAERRGMEQAVQIGVDYLASEISTAPFVQPPYEMGMHDAYRAYIAAIRAEAGKEQRHDG